MWCFWSPKGGSGCSAVTAAVAVLTAAREQVLLVDLCGDQPAVLGAETPDRGLRHWADAPAPPPDGIGRLEVPLTPELALLPAGGTGPEVAAAFDDERSRLLARLLADDQRTVVVDAGTLAASGQGVGFVVADEAAHSIAVTRACYLAAARMAIAPSADGLVVIREGGRLLSDDDLAAALGPPVLAALRWDAAVAAAVDAGSLLRQVPRSLRRLLPLVRSEVVR